MDRFTKQALSELAWDLTEQHQDAFSRWLTARDLGDIEGTRLHSGRLRAFAYACKALDDVIDRLSSEERANEPAGGAR